MSDSEQPRGVFFVHMQKTAGTALRQGLINHFGKRAVYPTQGVDGTDPTQLVTSTDYLRERLAARGDEIEAITGHFPLCTTELLDGRYTTLTLLREPVERTLSYLRHHRKEEPADRDKSLEEIYEDPFRFASFVHNHMTKMLSLTPAEMTDGMLTSVKLNESHLERAKEALAGIDAVGLQERFDEFFGSLEERFGWHLGEAEMLNTTDPVGVAPSFRERIADDNALDVELYEFAHELVGSRPRRKRIPETEAPAISVIIPTYNRASLLERSLESLTEQTLPRDAFEVVVVDDGSSDWTRSVCTKLADRLPLRYFRIENSGISAAKNLGVFASRAALLFFFDDDDVADPGLLEAHVEAHREQPDENVAVLGYTTWAPELEVTPIMEYVTEIGQQLFSYKNLEDGQRLDYTYFWGGRSSCKRSLLTTYGSFNQDFPSIIEDMELGFRLAKQGLSVTHIRAAKSYMLRPVTFDQVAERCVRRGRALWRFAELHPEPKVERYCRVEEAIEKWPSLEPHLEEKAERVRELERRHAAAGELDPEEWAELRELYGWTLEAFQARGVAEAAAESSGGAPAEGRAPSLGSSPGTAICEQPIFIIGSPRSGTSILAWSLAAHSELWTEAESDIFYYLLRDGSLENAYETSTARTDGSWLRNQGVELDDFLVHVGLGLNAMLTGTSDGRRWIDQTPANTLVVDRLAEMFPGARFLHILRDGRRVVHSMINFHRAMGDQEAVERMRDAGRLPPWTTDFGDACRTWARFVGIATDFGRRNPERTHTLTNEGLITDPDGTMREVLEFLGEDQEPGPARFLRENRINSSFAASGRSDEAPPVLSEPWLEWLPEQREAFLENAGQMMIECGLATEAELRGDGGSLNGRSGNGAGRREARRGTGSRSP